MKGDAINPLFKIVFTFICDHGGGIQGAEMLLSHPVVGVNTQPLQPKTF